MNGNTCNINNWDHFEIQATLSVPYIHFSLYLLPGKYNCWPTYFVSVEFHEQIGVIDNSIHQMPLSRNVKLEWNYSLHTQAGTITEYSSYITTFFMWAVITVTCYNGYCTKVNDFSHTFVPFLTCNNIGQNMKLWLNYSSKREKYILRDHYI